MIATTMLPSYWQRFSVAAVDLLQKFLMAAGLVFVLGFAALQAGYPELVDGVRALLPSANAAPVEESDDELSAAAAAEVESTTHLSPRMQRALDYVAKRYRVSNEALQPIFAAAQASGREHHIDPLLIVAVIGIESRFNPFSESVFGAQGLMQVVPRFHLDKLPEEADRAAFLDPVTNVQVGVRVLNESIRRFGGIEEGLQQFAGAMNDPERRYASKVLAEKQRLEQAAGQRRSTTG